MNKSEKNKHQPGHILLNSIFILLFIYNILSAWTGTLMVYVVNSDGETVPRGATTDTSVNGLHFETYLIKRATGETSKLETEQSTPLFLYTVEDYEGAYYGHIDITLSNYKFWRDSLWEPTEYEDGDTIVLRILDTEYPGLGECYHPFSYWCDEMKLTFTEAEWTEPTVLNAVLETPPRSGWGERKFSFIQAEFTEGSIFIDTLDYFCGLPRSKDDELPIPEDYFLSICFPDPLVDSTVFKYILPETVYVVLSITDLEGVERVVLVDEVQSPGYEKVVWYGEDTWGIRLEPGVYLYILYAGSFVKTRRVTIE